MTTFIRLLDIPVDAKPDALKAAVTGDGLVFERAPEAFATVPGSPFAYWASDDFREIFKQFPRFESENRIARKGLTTSADERYVRVWWEPGSATLGRSWCTYAKGGAAELFYAPIHTLVSWDPMLRTIPGYCGRAGRETVTVECADLMGRPGLTWPLRAAFFSPSVLPSASVFSARGYTIQAPVGELLYLLAITASTAFDAVFKLCLGRSGHPEFIVGVLQRSPLPRPDLISKLLQLPELPTTN